MTFSEIRFLKTENALEPAGFQISRILAWEAVVLPIYESCTVGGIIANSIGKFNPFLSTAMLPRLYEFPQTLSIACRMYCSYPSFLSVS